MNYASRPFTHGDTLIPINDPWNSQSLIYVSLYDGELQFLRISSHEDPTLSFVNEPNINDVFIKPKLNSKGAREYAAIESIASMQLRQNNSLGIKSLKGRVKAMKSGLQDIFIENSIRCLLANKKFEAFFPNEKSKTPKLRLSDAHRTYEDRRTYATSFANDLDDQSKRIGALFAHGSTVGTYREDLFRELIKRHIPKRFHAATGFIDGCPKQLDILIYDQLEYAPIFRTGDLVVVPADAVRAVIEVKSTLNTKELKNALCGLTTAVCHVRGLLETSIPPIFTGLFAYEGLKPATLITAVKAHHNAKEIDIASPPFIVDVGQMVSAICVLKLDFGKRF